jgi:glycosyltransferase involved in cell wall biosynthesis
MIDQSTYVLMTAAHNEQATIGNTIESVLSQSKLPTQWVIVSDGSDDKTDQIVQIYEKKHRWIRYVRVTRQPGRSFASKVIALQFADRALRNERFGLIGNIDADVTLEPTYFAQLVDRLNADPTLGIVSGFVYEQSAAGRYVSRRLNSDQSVPHAAQLVRRACYESIGGYAVLRYGGEDWHALVSARMKGWRVEAFPHLKIFHHRPDAPAGRIRNSFVGGRMDYSLGCYPPFEALKCLRRFSSAYFTGGIIRMCGFLWGYLLGEKRPVSGEFVAFLRKEQKERVIAILKGFFRRIEEIL